MAVRGGYSPFIKLGIGGGGSSLHPFKVIWQATPNNPGAFRYYVYEGALFQSLRPDDNYTLNSLNGITLQSDIDSDNITWKNLDLNDIIWLTIIFYNNGAIESVTVNSLGNGDVFNVDNNAWTGDNGYCEDNGETTGVNAYKHQTSRIVLAYSYSDGGANPSPIVVNSVTTHLLLRNVCIDGRPARYPFPTGGGYPI